MVVCESHGLALQICRFLELNPSHICKPQGKGQNHLSQKLIKRPPMRVRYHGADGLNLCMLGLPSTCIASASIQYLCG